MSKEKSLFEKLYAMNVSDKLEKKEVQKGKYLSYLSWAFAWAEVKKIDPNATQKIHEYPMLKPDKSGIIEGIFVPYLETPTGFYVTVSVTINGHTETETLPVMDERNAPLGTTMWAWSRSQKGVKEEVKTPTPTSFEINKNTKRCLVKAIALHGLGLYVYSGEDLPEEEQQEKQQATKQPEKKQQPKKAEDLPKFNPISQKTLDLMLVFDQEVASLTGKMPMQPLQLLVKNPDFNEGDLGGLTEDQGTKLTTHLENWIKKLKVNA